jgi:hypothetical protein
MVVEKLANLVSVLWRLIRRRRSGSCWRASITAPESILIKWNVFHINTIVKEGSYNLVINTQQSSRCWRASITLPESILIKWNVFHINTIVKEGSYNLVINTQQNYYQNSESELLENWILGCTYVWKPELEPDSRFLAKCFFNEQQCCQLAPVLHTSVVQLCICTILNYA